MPKLPLAATAVASILVTLATGSVAQTLPPQPSARNHLFQREDPDVADRLSRRSRAGRFCDLRRGRSLGYGECQGPGAAALQSLSRRRLLWQDLG
jgi:hypothetical protein